MKNECIKCLNKPDPSTGYGRKYKDGVLTYEHRLAFQEANTEVDITDKIVHHKCGNPACINPKHLKAITRKEHSAEHGLSGWAKIHAAKTHCKNGHLFDREYRGTRKCSICVKKAANKYARNHREQSRDWKRRWRRRLGIKPR